MGEQDFRSRYLMKVGITKRDELGRAEPDAGGAQPRATDTSALGGARAHEADEGGAEVAAGAASKTSPPALRRRATDDFRLAYIQKLTASRAFIPHLSRPKSAQTVTIFDWDDTLMATTHVELVMQHFGGIPSSTKEQLKPLDRVSAALLALAETSGKVRPRRAPRRRARGARPRAGARRCSMARHALPGKGESRELRAGGGSRARVIVFVGIATFALALSARRAHAARPHSAEPEPEPEPEPGRPAARAAPRRSRRPCRPRRTHPAVPGRHYHKRY